MAFQLDAVDLQIVAALKVGGEMTTGALAEQLGLERQVVYRHCRKLKERANLLDKKKGVSERVLSFSPIFGEVVTKQNVRRDEELISELDEVVAAHGVPRRSLDPKQKRAIVSALTRKLRERGIPPQRVRIVRSRVEKALENCGPSHARGAYRGVPFSPPAAVWSLHGDIVVEP